MEQDISNGNHNDFDWRNKIEDIGNFPDAILANRNATWEKLHKRLHEKQGVKPLWYWLAAACVLFAIIIPVMIGNKKQNSVAKNTIEKVLPKKETIAATPSSKEVAVDVSTSVNENKAIRGSLHSSKKRPSDNDKAIKKESGYAGFNEQTEIANEPIISPEKDTVAVNTLAVAPVKKRLKVVHINELDPLLESPNVAGQYEQHSFQLKLINLHSSTGISLPSESRGFTFFKTMKASSN